MQPLYETDDTPLGIAIVYYWQYLCIKSKPIIYQREV